MESISKTGFPVHSEKTYDLVTARKYMICDDEFEAAYATNMAAMKAMRRRNLQRFRNLPRDTKAQGVVEWRGRVWLIADWRLPTAANVVLETLCLPFLRKASRQGGYTRRSIREGDVIENWPQVEKALDELMGESHE